MGNGFAFGYYAGGLIFGGVLPAAFIFYGTTQRRRWAVIVGWVIAAFFVLGSLGGGSFNVASALALGLCVAASFAKPRKPA